jgi:hypothetical protein
MDAAEYCTIITSLHALRSQAGVVSVHAQQARSLKVSAHMADIQADISNLIEVLNSENSTPAHADKTTT